MIMCENCYPNKDGEHKIDKFNTPNYAYRDMCKCVCHEEDNKKTQ